MAINAIDNIIVIPTHIGEISEIAWIVVLLS